MALQVNYKNPYGYVTITQKRKGVERKYKVTLCKCNAMWAEMYFYTQDNGEKMAQLYCFIADIQHLKNCIKDNCLVNYDNFVFKYKEIKGNKQIWKAIQMLTENGKKVTIK